MHSDGIPETIFKEFINKFISKKYADNKQFAKLPSMQRVDSKFVLLTSLHRKNIHYVDSKINVC